MGRVGWCRQREQVLFYHPYSFLNDKGEPDGFSIDIAKAMDFGLKFRAGRWDLAMNQLEVGTIDLIPLMAYTPERSKLFDFSVPYTVVYDAIFFKKGTTGINSLKDLSGKTVIVTNNDLAHNYLLSSGLSKTMSIILAESGPDALKQLSAGKGDAAIMPKLIGLVTLKRLKMSGIETSPCLLTAIIENGVWLSRVAIKNFWNDSIRGFTSSKAPASTTPYTANGSARWKIHILYGIKL